MMREWIEAALDGSGWSFDAVMDGVQAGDFYLFENDRAVLVCEVIASPRHRVFHCWAAGGDMEGVEALVPEAEAFGIRLNCDSAGATGRAGWVRALAKLGYSQAVTAVEKEL